MRILDFTSITEEQGKTAVFAFGRMNPPTIGHKKLADAVLAQAGDPYIFLSQSQKPQTDPLDFATKLKFAQKFFPGITVGNPEVKTVIQALTKLDQLGYDNIIYIAGSDRIADFTELLNQYNGQPDKKGNVAYKFNDIQVVSAGERDPDAEGAEGMSASKMRAAAAAGEFEAFASGTPDPKLAKPMYDAVRSGMGIAESTYSQRMLKVIETLQDLHRAKPLDEATSQYVLKQLTTIREHLNNINEAYSPEIDDKWIEREIRANAKKHGIDPNVAVRVWRSEGGSSKNYQSKIKRSGKGSVGGQEASYGPYQLYTGGGLGNEYQEKYGVDLSADNSPEGLQRQIDFALGKAKKVGWKPWYGAAKAGIGDRDGIDGTQYADAGNIATDASRDGIDGTQYADAGNIATDASVDNSGPSDFGAAFASARKKHGGAGGKFTWQGKEYQTNVKGEKYVTNPVSVDEATLDLPDLETGDELMVGKFKNRKATIKDFKKDEHGQPVAVTNKGDQKIFKGRVKKLMPTEGKSPHKKGTEKYRKHMAAMHASAEPKGTMIEGISYADPQFDVEWEEANRYPYLEKLGSKGWKELAKTGRAVRVTTDSVKKIGNTGADGSESLDDLEPEKVARLKQAMDSGTVEMPIVVKQPDDSLELIAGNTRLIGLISTQGEAQVWLVDASTLTEGVGRIVKGVNTTPDVGVNQTKIEAAKLGSKVDKDGRPPLLHKKAAKNSDTNTLFNLGLAEGKLSENNKSHAVVIKFVNHCKDKLELPNIPTITLVDRIGGKTFGQYNTVKKDIAVQLADRHIVDVLRTLAHELVHHKQRHLHSNLDGSDGSDHENQANALAGKLMRQFGKRYPKLYEGLQERSSIGVPLSSGLTVNIAPHRELKIKKSTMGRHNYENPRTKKSRKS